MAKIVWRYGPPPSDPDEFSKWLARINKLIEDKEKAGKAKGLKVGQYKVKYNAIDDPNSPDYIPKDERGNINDVPNLNSLFDDD